MEKRPTVLDTTSLPDPIRPFAENTAVYDSSSSAAARVYYLEKEGGYYLKCAPKGTLAKEAALTAFFHEKGLSPALLAYHSADADWLLTEKAAGRDATDPSYLDQPTRLCDLLATTLRALHELDPTGCPVPDRTTDYLAAARHNYFTGQYDASLFPDNFGYACAEDGIRTLDKYANAFSCNVLLHGDYCLPNILLDHWRFSALIDVGNGGVGDRHIDLFWGIWSLYFNTGTDRYTDRFLDAYGRDKIETSLLAAVAAAEVFG